MKKILRVLGIIENCHKAKGDMTLAEIEDNILDAIEEKIERSDNKLDDQMILPVIKFIRFVGNIPDNDGADNEA